MTAGADTVVQMIVATAGSSVLLATIQGIFTRRKTKAEVEGAGAVTTKVITDAAASVVVQIQADNTALRAEVAALRAEVAAARKEVAHLERWKDAAEENFQRHEVWDIRVAAQLPSVSAPPPLRPDMQNAT